MPSLARRTNLDRIAPILLAFDPQSKSLASRALVECADASPAAGFGLFRALSRADLLERVDHGPFRLGSRAAGFAYAPLAWPAARQTEGASPAADRSILEQDWSVRLSRTIDCSALERPPPYRLGFVNASLSNYRHVPDLDTSLGDDISNWLVTRILGRPGSSRLSQVCKAVS